jgi:hypothetical protein
MVPATDILNCCDGQCSRQHDTRLAARLQKWCQACYANVCRIVYTLSGQQPEVVNWIRPVACSARVPCHADGWEFFCEVTIRCQVLAGKQPRLTPASGTPKTY